MKLWMIIGVPGSGKSTKAEQIANCQEKLLGYKPEIFEADMFFLNKNGEYNWNKDLLPAAHMWCFKQVENELKSGKSVIVANTFIKAAFRKVYFKLAKKYNADVKVITCTGHYQNIHDVPAEKVELMRNKFQPFSSEELL